MTILLGVIALCLLPALTLTVAGRRSRKDQS